MKTLLCLLMFLLQFQLNGQLLNGILNESKQIDTSHVNRLLELSANYSVSNPGKSLLFAEKALSSSRTQDYLLGMARANSMIANYYNIAGDYMMAIHYNAEAINCYDKLDDRKSMADSYMKAGSILSSVGLWDESKQHLIKALDIYFALDDKQSIARVTGNIKMILELSGNEYKLPSNSLIALPGNKAGVIDTFSAQTYGNAAIVMYFIGNYDKAILFFIKGIEAAQKKNNVKIIPRYQSYLGLLYKEIGDNNNAVNHFVKALEAYKVIEDSEGIVITNFNLGQLYEQMLDLDKALNYYLRAANIAEKIELKVLIPKIYQRAGNVSVNLNTYSGAFEYYNRSLSAAVKLNDLKSIVDTYLKLGELNELSGRNDEAANFYGLCLETAKKAGYYGAIGKATRKLAMLAAKRGDYKKAFEYQQKLYVFKDSMTFLKSKTRMNQLEARYILESKENEIAILKKNNEIVNLEIKNQRTTWLFLITGIFIISVFLVILYNRLLIIRKSNKLLKKQRVEIIEKNAKLTELNAALINQKKVAERLNNDLLQMNIKLRKSEESLIETNKAKDKFFSIISHDLRSPFATIVSFAKLLRKDIGKFSKADLQEMAEEFSGSVTQVNNLLENLLQWSRSQTGKISNKAENIILEDIIEDSLSLFSSVFKEKELVVKTKIQKPIIVVADRNMLDTVMRNLISNAAKYSYQGQEININAYTEGRNAKIEVVDHGVGISEENLNKLFYIATAQTTFGTNYEKGSGLGLLLCHEFVERMGGEISVTSKVNEGSKFVFSLPLQQ